MKIVLVITVCNQNRKRITSQVNNLKWSLIPEGIEITPVFVFGKGGDTSDIPFQTLVVDVNEEYNLLYRKLFEAYKIISKTFDYDFICKIDDDTKINTESFTKYLIENEDYVGRMFEGNTEATITLRLDFYNINRTINLKPTFFSGKSFIYATGDCYFLSKKAVNYILSSEEVLSKCGNARIEEDRLFGYMLSDKDVKIKDINMTNEVIEENELQVTTDYFTIHPIGESILSSLIGVKIKEQLPIINNGKLLNLTRRKAYMVELENQLRKVIDDFSNAKKSIGMG